MRFVVVVAVLLIGLSTSSLETVTGYSAEMRAIAAVLLAGAIVGFSRQSTAGHRNRRSALRAASGIAAGYAILSFAATVPHGLDDLLYSRLLATGVMLLAVYALVTFFEPEVVVSATQGALQALLLMSYGLLAIAPDIGFEFERARGVFENANLLGFVAAFAIIVAIATRSSGKRIAWIMVLALPLLVMSASRASLVMLAFALVGLAAAGVPAARKLVLASVLALPLAFVFWYSELQGVVIFRLEDSRLSALDVVEYAWKTDQWFGLGALSLDRESGGFVVAGALPGSVIQGGVIGLGGLIVMWFSLVKAGAAAGRVTLVTSCAVVLHSVFESSFLAMSGAMFLLLMLGWVSVAFSESPNHDSVPHTPSRKDGPADQLSSTRSTRALR